MNKKVITTVGTSVFSNILKDKEKLFETTTEADKYQKDYEKLEKEPSDKWAEYEDKAIKRLRKTTLSITKNNPNASAEIKSSIAIANDLKEDIEVHLLATDSVLSRLACEIIKEWFKEYKTDKGFEITTVFNEKQDVIVNLQISHNDNFKEGLVQLLKRFYQKTDSDIISEHYSNTIINITGGYKGVIPYLTLLAQINNFSIQYIFEETDVLLKIPQIPLDIKEQLFEDYWDNFSFIENEVSVPKNSSFNFEKDAESCLEEENGEVSLNYLGIALWEKYKSKYFVFYSTDKVWKELESNERLLSYFKQTFTNEQLRKSSNVTEGTHSTVCKKFHDTLRIYWFKKDSKIYVYKAFENHAAHELYINAVTFNESFINEFQLNSKKIKILK